MNYIRIIVTGIVQGVGFRAFIYRNALKLSSLTGYVKNLSDGSVEIVCSGTADDINSIIEYAKQGPYGSRVDSVNITDIQLDREFQDFRIA